MEFEISDDIDLTKVKFVYNRFDLLYGDSHYIKAEDNGKTYVIPFHVEKESAYIGVAMLDIPQEVFDGMIQYIFREIKQVKRIWILASRNNYKNAREGYTYWHVDLPASYEELLARTTPKSRYNMKRSERLLREKGEVDFRHADRGEITKEIVDRYFSFKEETYGTDYHMDWQEYLDKYHVTDTYLIYLNGELISVSFTCEQCECVFLENLSYDSAYAKFSTGFQVYSYTLKMLIEKGFSALYLGGGDFAYKQRFDGIGNTVYSGFIYKNDFYHFIYGLYAKCRQKLKKKR